MTIRVKNIQYFDWEVPEELKASKDMPDELIQQLIDEHLDPDNLYIEQVSDDYYEFEEFL
jgi:Mg2+ and Co2+ transporter CorA